MADADTRSKHCRRCRRITPHDILDDSCEWCSELPQDRFASTVNFFLFYFVAYFVLGAIIRGE